MHELSNINDDLLHWFFGEKCITTISPVNYKLSVHHKSGRLFTTNEIVNIFRGVYSSLYIKNFIDKYKLKVIDEMVWV